MEQSSTSGALMFGHRIVELLRELTVFMDEKLAALKIAQAAIESEHRRVPISELSGAKSEPSQSRDTSSTGQQVHHS